MRVPVRDAAPTDIQPDEAVLQQLLAPVRVTGQQPGQPEVPVPVGLDERHVLAVPRHTLCTLRTGRMVVMPAH